MINKIIEYLGIWFLIVGLVSASPARAEDVEYFESTYQIKLKGIREIKDYSDPDEFYSEIGRQLGIHTLAGEIVQKKEGWSAKNSPIMNATIKRGDDLWVVLIFRVARLTAEKKPDMESLEMRYLTINDKKELIYYGETWPPPKKQLK